MFRAALLRAFCLWGVLIDEEMFNRAKLQPIGGVQMVDQHAPAQALDTEFHMTAKPVFWTHQQMVKPSLTGPEPGDQLGQRARVRRDQFGHVPRREPVELQIMRPAA